MGTRVRLTCTHNLYFEQKQEKHQELYIFYYFTIFIYFLFTKNEKKNVYYCFSMNVAHVLIYSISLLLEEVQIIICL